LTQAADKPDQQAGAGAPTSTLPELRTDRLVLRGLDERDVPAIVGFCKDREIARGTRSVPHPYTEEAAREFLTHTGAGLNKETCYVWGIALADSGQVIGDTGLEVDRANNNAETGFIVGKQWWGHGYATEACRAALAWGFESLGLHRIFGHCMTWNEASARVMLKAGMLEEGTLRGHYLKWGVYEDARVFGLTRPDWERMKKERTA